MNNRSFNVHTNKYKLQLWRWSLLMVLCLGLSSELFAQKDLLITQANEQIRCSILDESSTRFQYLYLAPSGKVLRNEIFKNLVKEFKYNAFDSDTPEFEALKSGKKSKKPSNTKKPEQKPDPKEAKTLEEKKPIEVEKPEEAVDTTSALTETVTPEPILSKKEASKKPKEEEKIERKKQDTPKEKPEEVLEMISKDTLMVEPVPVNFKSKDSVTSEKPSYSKDTLTIKPRVLADTTAAIKPEKVKSDSVLIKKEEPARVIMEKDSSLSIPTSLPKNDSLTVEKVDKKPEVPQVETPKVKVDSIQTKTTTKETILDTEKVQSFGSQWRIGLKAGIGNIRDNNFSANNAYDLYQEKLMKGYLFGADIAYFFSKVFGLGLVYTDFKSNNSSKGLNYINLLTGSEVSGGLSNRISRKFIGPSVFLRKSIDNKTFGVLGLSPGIYLYNDKGDYNGALFQFKSQQFGGAATLGLDFLLGNDVENRDIIFSLEAGYNYGRIDKLDLGNGQSPLVLTNNIILDRLDFSVGLRFLRFPSYLRTKN